MDRGSVRWPSSDNLHSPEATIQRHDNDMTTTQRHHNNNTILLKQAAGAVRENPAKPLPLSIRDDQGVIHL